MTLARTSGEKHREREKHFPKELLYHAAEDNILHACFQTCDMHVLKQI